MKSFFNKASPECVYKLNWWFCIYIIKIFPTGHLHSCLMAAMLMGMKGDLADLLGLRMSRHNRREILVSGVVIRQKAARVFIMGRGLPDRTTRPCAVARCRAKCAFSRNSWNTLFLIHYICNFQLYWLWHWKFAGSKSKLLFHEISHNMTSLAMQRKWFMMRFRKMNLNGDNIFVTEWFPGINYIILLSHIPNLPFH